MEIILGSSLVRNECLSDVQSKEISMGETSSLYRDINHFTEIYKGVLDIDSNSWKRTVSKLETSVLLNCICLTSDAPNTALPLAYFKRVSFRITGVDAELLRFHVLIPPADTPPMVSRDAMTSKDLIYIIKSEASDGAYVDYDCFYRYLEIQGKHRRFNDYIIDIFPLKPIQTLIKQVQLYKIYRDAESLLGDPSDQLLQQQLKSMNDYRRDLEKILGASRV